MSRFDFPDRDVHFGVERFDGRLEFAGQLPQFGESPFLVGLRGPAFKRHFEFQTGGVARLAHAELVDERAADVVVVAQAGDVAFQVQVEHWEQFVFRHVQSHSGRLDFLGRGVDFGAVLQRGQERRLRLDGQWRGGWSLGRNQFGLTVVEQFGRIDERA